jgi:hypothetical protein
MSEPVPVIDNPSQFELNPEFMKIVHKIIGENITNEKLFGPIINVNKDANMFYSIYDLRAPPAYGRIPEVEDTLGMVEIRNGSIVAGSYDPNSMYRPVSSYGFITLPDGITDLVRDALENK